MTEKRFSYHYDGFGAYYLCDKEKGTYEDSIIMEIWADKSDIIDLVNLLNKLSEENEQLKQENKELRQDNDIKFWKLQCLQSSNNNQVMLLELGRAIKQGYEVSDKFKQYLDEIKEHNKEIREKHKRLFE